MISIGRLPKAERADLVMYFIDRLSEVKHEITMLLSRTSSLVAPWGAVRLLLLQMGIKPLATSRRRIAVADELGTQH